MKNEFLEIKIANKNGIRTHSIDIDQMIKDRGEVLKKFES